MFLTVTDSNLVLLDECLSAVDQASREFLIDELRMFLEGKTCIIITHHTEMLRICQRVQEMPTRVNRNLKGINRNEEEEV